MPGHGLDILLVHSVKVGSVVLILLLEVVEAVVRLKKPTLLDGAVELQL